MPDTHSATFLESVGGDGSTVTDDANPNTGLDDGGHRERFVPALAQVVAVASFVVDRADDAEAAAAAALNSPGTSATSTTSIAIPTAFPTTVPFTLQELNKLFVKGQSLTFADDADPSKQFTGVLMLFDPVTKIGSLKALQSTGTGTLSNWHVSLAAPVDGTLSGRVGTLEALAVTLADQRRFFDGSMF